MKEIRLHGRFGQPVGDLVKKIANHALDKGYHVQAFNSFATVRPGAPTFGVIRIDSQKILQRSTSEVEADVVIVLDNSLFAVGGVLKGLKNPGMVMALGMDKDILGDQEAVEFQKLDCYFEGNPSDVGGNIIKALEDLAVI